MHASFVRSPYSHAKILKINISEALKLDGVEAVLTGEDVIKWSEPFVVGVKQPMEHWCLGVKKVLYTAQDTSLHAGIELEGQEYGRLRTSNDFAAGVKAFNEKKKAKWSGT